MQGLRHSRLDIRRETTAPVAMNAQQNRPTHSAPIRVTGLLEASSAVLCLLTFTGFLGRLWWILELTVHFRLHYGILLGAFTAAWIALRRWPLAAFCGVAAMTNLALVGALYWPAPDSPATGGHRVRLAIVNVRTSNPRADLVIDWLQRADPDVALLMEINERWLTQLGPLRAAYPHQVCEPRDDNFGIGLFSRLPLRTGRADEIGEAGVPSVEAELQVGNAVFSVIGTHALPPSTAANARFRNEQFQALAARVRQQTLPVILCGDLNVTPWSPWFADLLRESGLRNSAQGRGLFGSWPAWLPWGRIPLDHCLVSAQIGVRDRRLGPRVGSDHLPVLVDLVVPGSWSLGSGG